MKKLLCLSVILSSCVLDHISKIAVIQNKSIQNIIVVDQLLDSINDEMLFHGYKLDVKADSVKIFFSMFSSKKMHFCFFNSDTVYKYINENKIEGIVKKSFLKQITISKDSLEKNDTLIYCETCPNSM